MERKDLEDGSNKNLSSQESQDTYDKLHTTDSEYAYVYSHNANPKLLHVAAMGSYRIDSAVVSSTEKDKRPSTVAKKEDGGKSDGQSTVFHQYQPLNEVNNGSNSYAHLVKQ